MSIHLSTGRLQLRGFSPDDVNALFAYRNDERCARFQRWENSSFPYLEDYIDRFADSVFLSDAPEQHYAIALADGSLIGDLSVFMNADDRCITLGYTIAPDAQRKGYAYELLSAVLPLLRGRFPRWETVGLVSPDNLPSRRLLQKLSFQEECYAEKIQSFIYVLPPIDPS